MLYLAPARLQEMLGGVALPFVPGGVSTDPRLARATRALLAQLAAPLDALEQDDGLFELATALQLATGSSPRPVRGDYRAARIAREFMDDRLDSDITLEEPRRRRGPRSMEPLARFPRQLRHQSVSLSDAETARPRATVDARRADARGLRRPRGLLDQSHLTRQFAKAFGVTPARWLRMSGAPGAN